MYSFSYLESVCSSMSSSNCCFLTCIQISQEADQVVWYSHLFQNFPQFIVMHYFGIVNKAEIDVFLELSCFFHDPADVGNLISGSSAFSKTSLNIKKFTVHILLKPGLENFEHYFTSISFLQTGVGSFSFFTLLLKSLILVVIRLLSLKVIINITRLISTMCATFILVSSFFP